MIFAKKGEMTDKRKCVRNFWDAFDSLDIGKSK
jgi:hypothetical protein